MSSFVQTNLGSDSDSDDSDFDPSKEGSAEVVSEEEDSGDNEDGGTEKKNKGKGKKKQKKKQTNETLGKRTGGLFIDETEADRKKEEEEERKKEFENEKVEKKEKEEKKKLDDIWASFKKDVVPSKPATAAKAKPVGSSLGSWSMSTAGSKSKVVKKPATVSQKKPPIDIFASNFDKVEDKKIKEKVTENAIVQPRSIISSIFDEKEKSSESAENINVAVDDDVTGDADKVTITKVFDFAGESVKVTKQVSKDSKEGQEFMKKQESASSSGDSISQQQSASTSQKRPGGLSSIMGAISGKKPKLGTLDKSKMDWNKFIEQEGIKEELLTHNKGKDGYVEKQMFLERADLRRFEIEKEAREKTRKTLNR